MAFVINCITRCDPAYKGVQAVIISPTVLLNKQTAEVVEELAKGTGITVAAAIDRNDPEYVALLWFLSLSLASPSSSPGFELIRALRGVQQVRSQSPHSGADSVRHPAHRAWVVQGVEGEKVHSQPGANHGQFTCFRLPTPVRLTG